MICYIVIDTSYLLELFKVPNHYNSISSEIIKQRFDHAIDKKCRLYIPIPVLFELANHIAHVSDGRMRRVLANQFIETVNKGVNPEVPFLNILPCEAFAIASELRDNLMSFCNEFAENYVYQGLSLTDSAVVMDARKLKTTINKVHIWTLEQSIKAFEPDTEPYPFVN